MTPTPPSPQSLGEEIANSVSHGIGFLAALIAMPFLILKAVRMGDTKLVVGVSIFALSVALLYLSSTLYHALPQGKAKQTFRVLEHGAIFILIAGTYTPFTLGVLRGPLGWTLFGIVWGLAILGVILKAVGGVRYPILSPLLYVCMGWIIVIAIRPLSLRVSHSEMVFLILGGVAYTAGLGFFAATRMRYNHFIWHLFVLTGTTFHFFALLWHEI